MAGAPRVLDSNPGKRPEGQASGDDTGQRLLKILSHPVRIEVLRELQHRVASPKELADELGEPLSTVSYHFKYLRSEGCIEILETQPRRGAVEHFYRAKATLEVRDLMAEAVRALDAGTFDAREDGNSCWMPMELDEKGWRELIDRQAEWVKELERIRADAGKRLVKGDAASRRVVSGLIAFETPPGPGFAASEGEKAED
jgi:DNA-binding transcriptional ArsR family regulator